MVLVLCTSCLFGQVTPKTNSQLQTWPPSNAPKATWKRIESNHPKHKKLGPDTFLYVGLDSSYYSGRFRGKQFILRYLRPGTSGSGSLLLTIGEKEHTFTEVPPDWRLDWAGDADNDGKLDLIISTVGDGGGTSTDLFLSTLAKEGELLRHSATLEGEEGC
jgi:hypothetical protein